MHESQRKISRIILGLGIALVLVGGMIGPLQANAADPIEEMTISPTEKHYEVNPGETISDSFVILNSGQTVYDFITYSSPYSVSNGSYDAQYDVNAPRSDAYKWVQMNTTQWHAEVRQTTTIPFTLRVPANASPGGHYGIIFAETKAQDDAAGIARKKRIGIVLYVKVKGDIVNEGRVTNIATGWFYSHPPVTATVTIEDKGNTDFTAQSKMTVTDLFGGVKYTGSKDYNVLPGTTRDVSLTYDDPPWFGLFKVKVEATVMGNTTTRESFVLVAPYWLFVTLGIALLLGVVNVVRRKNAKGPQRAAK